MHRSEAGCTSSPDPILTENLKVSLKAWQWMKLPLGLLNATSAATRNEIEHFFGVFVSMTKFNFIKTSLAKQTEVLRIEHWSRVVELSLYYEVNHRVSRKLGWKCFTNIDDSGKLFQLTKIYHKVPSEKHRKTIKFHFRWTTIKSSSWSSTSCTGKKKLHVKLHP